MKIKRDLSPVLLVVLALLGFATPLSAGKPLPAGPEAYTQKDYVEARLAFFRRIMLEAYRAHGRRGEAWDATVERALEAFAHHFAGTYQGLDPPERHALTQAAIDAGCGDPLVLYCHALDLERAHRRPDAEPLYRAAAEAMAESEYDPLWRAFAIHRHALTLRAMDRPADADRLDEALRGALLEALARPEWPQGEQRHALAEMWFYFEDAPLENVEKLVEALQKAEGADPWLVGVIAGRYHVRQAWEARGGGWAREVTEEGWVGFAEHLAQARTLLNDAWKRNPWSPEAATAMIAVAMAGHAGEGEDERLWFDRAVEAQFDWRPAYQSYLWALWPRWGGSHEAMYAFGVECLKTGRFDTGVPFVLAQALEAIRADSENGFEFWKRPGVYENLAALLDGMETEPAQAHQHDWYRSFRAAAAWQLGRYEDAAAALVRIEAGVRPDAFHRLGADPERVAADAVLLTGPLREAVEEARRREARRDHAGALALYEQALAQARDERAARLLRRHRELARCASEFQVGEWVELSFDPDLTLWRRLHGQWTPEADGSITAVSARDGLMLECLADFEPPYEIEGRVEFVVGPYSGLHGGVLMNFAHRRSWNGLLAFFREGEARLAWSVRGLDEHPSTLAPVRESTRLRVRLRPGKLTAWVNGGRVFRGYDLSEEPVEGGRHVALGGVYWYDGATLRFRDWRIRKLEDEGDAAAAEGELPETRPAP